MAANPNILAMSERLSQLDKKKLSDALAAITAGAVDTDSTLITVAHESALTHSRRLAVSGDLTLTDTGAGGSITIGRTAAAGATAMTGLWHFGNEQSGFVLYGSPNGTPYRLFIDDSSGLAIISIETYSTAHAGDVSFGSSAFGPVIYGRYSTNLFRFVVDDTDASAPVIGVTQLASSASVQAQDYWFVQGGGFLTRGRTINANGQYNCFLWYCDDSGGFPIISAERFGV